MMEGLSEMDIQEWAFSNEPKILEQAELRGGELISFIDKKGFYLVVALYKGYTIAAQVEQEWIEREVTS